MAWHGMAWHGTGWWVKVTKQPTGMGMLGCRNILIKSAAMAGREAKPGESCVTASDIHIRIRICVQTSNNPFLCLVIYMCICPSIHPSIHISLPSSNRVLSTTPTYPRSWDRKDPDQPHRIKLIHSYGVIRLY